MAALSAFATPLTHAADLYWDPAGDQSRSGGAGNWNTTNLFWDEEPSVAPNVAWTNGQDVAIFGGTGGAVVINGGNVTVGGITFSSTSYVISGATAADTLTVDGALVPINVANAGSVATISATLSGLATAGIQKTGAGTLSLTGANTFLGNLNASEGVLRAGGNAAALGAGTLTLSGASLQLVNDTALNFGRATTISANTSIVVDRATGGAGLTHTLGTLSMGAQTLNVSGGANITSGTAGLTFGAVTLTGNAGITTAAGALTTIGSVTGAFTLTVDGAGDTTITGSTAATVTGVTKNGTGTLTFTGDPNQNPGAFTVNAGVMAFNHGGATDAPVIINSGGTARIIGDNRLGDTNNVTVNSGGTFDLQGSDTIAQLLGTGTVTRTTTGTATLAIGNGSASFTFGGVINNGAGTVAITKVGTGITTFSNSSTFTGAFTVNSGPAVISGAGASFATATYNIGDNNGGTEAVTFGAGTDVWTTGALNRIVDTATVTLNGATTSAGAGGFTYIGPASGSSGNAETFGTLAVSNGRNDITLVPGTDNELQLNVGTLSRAVGGTSLIRGANLGGTGTGSTRLIATTASLTGGNGADGTTTRSILPWAVGDSSATGAGTGFLTSGTNGLRLLAAGEYDTTIAGTNGLRNVSTAGETVNASVRVNAVRVTGGTVTLASNTIVGVNSGAILATGASTVAGAGTLNFAGAEGIVQVASGSATTFGVNAVISGLNGLTVGGTGNNAHTVALGGNNTLVGTLRVNAVNLRLDSPGALNADYPVTILPSVGSNVLLNGNNVTVRDLQAGAGTGSFQNGSATAATLTTYLTANRAVSTAINNGSTGALSLIVSGGTFQLTLNQNSGYTGSTELRSGILLLAGNNVGEINDSTSYVIGGTLRLTNASSNNLGDRIRNASPVTMNAGVFDFDNPASGSTSFSETIGAVTLGSGFNTFTVDKAASGSTSVLTLASLARSAGAVVNFTSQNNGAAIFDLGTTTQSRLVLTAAPTLDNGIIGGWATVDSSATSREFAKYVTGTVTSVTSLVAADYTSTLSSGANPTQNVRIASSPAVLSAATDINSLNLQQTAATTVDLGTNTLRVRTGGIIQSGAFATSISNGTLTAGGAADAAGELFLHTVSPAANPLTISAVVGNNGAGQVALTKAGAGLLVLSGANTYGGATSLTQGTLRITSDGNLGTAPASFAAAHLRLSSPSVTTASTLDVAETLTLNANRGITLGSGLNVISVASGATAGSGKILTYNGAINSLAGTEGSLTFKSNYGTGLLGPGRVEGALTALNVNGTFRLEATTAAGVAVSGANSVVGRSLQVGLDGVASLTFTNAGGTLTIGKGIDDTLTVGSVATDFTGGVGTEGTLNLSALSQFNADLDTVRIGVASTNLTAYGFVTLAQNNTLTVGNATAASHTAGSIVIGTTANSGNTAKTSSLSFGSGTNLVRARSIVVGGFKAAGQMNMAAGGTVTLTGFAPNTLDLIAGINAGGTGTISTGTVDFSTGTLVGDFDDIVLGQKNGTGGSAGAGVGTLTLGASANNLVTANLVRLGEKNGDAITANTVGTLNIAGGSMTVFNNLVAGNNTSTSASGEARGFVNVSGGALTVDGDFVLAARTSTTSNSIGTLTLTGGSVTVGGNVTTTASTGATATVSLSGGTLDLTGGTISVDTFTAASGVLQNVGGLFTDTGTVAAPLTKTTAGTLTLLGTNSYTGNTVVSAGVLRVNGTSSGTAAVQVNAGKLEGIGSIAGTLTVGTAGGTALAATATVAPGNSIGTLTSTGSAIVLQPDSVFELEISTSGVVSSDLLQASSASLSIAPGASLTVTDLATAVVPIGTAIPFVTYNGTWNGGTFSVAGTPVADEVGEFTVGGNVFTIDYNYNGNQVALLAVPEPASVGLLAVGAVGLLSRRKRRSR